MQAIAVFPETCELKRIECDEPTITESTHVKLRMLDVGICGTDKEICTFEYGIPPDDSDHLIIGHESLGEVVEIGSMVDNIKVGDLVVAMVRRPCADAGCCPCRAGYQDFVLAGTIPSAA